MSTDIRDYLIERFRADAVTLRQRAEAMTAKGKPAPGPDAALSRAMAAACDDVAGLAEQLPIGASVEVIVSALKALLPELTARGNLAQSQAAPALRSVYNGAATRVQELIVAELDASAGASVARAEIDVWEEDSDGDDE